MLFRKGRSASCDPSLRLLLLLLLLWGRLAGIYFNALASTNRCGAGLEGLGFLLDLVEEVSRVAHQHQHAS